MSGKKCSNVTISSSSYNNLRNSVTRADNAAAAASRKAKEERAKNQKLQKDFRAAQQQMQQEFQQGLSAVSDDIRRVEETQSARLEGLRGEMYENFEAQSRAFSKAINDHRADVAAQITDIRDEISSDKEMQRSFAEQRVADVEQLLSLLGLNDEHERFAPGELVELQMRIQDSRDAIEMGQYQAAYSTAQERYYDYQELRVKIAERAAQWDARLELALRQSEKIAGDLTASQVARYRFGENDEVDVAAEVDFWTSGRLTDLIAAHNEIERSLETPKKNSIDDLERIQVTLLQLENEIEATVADARDRLVQSQHRREIGESVLQSFDGTIWSLEDSDYEGQDFRRGLHMKMTNSAEEEIVVIISPTENQEGGLSSTVEVNFFDHDNDELLRRERLEEMKQALLEQDVDVGRFQCMDNSTGQPGDTVRRDFEKMRQPIRETQTERAHLNNSTSTR